MVNYLTVRSPRTVSKFISQYDRGQGFSLKGDKFTIPASHIENIFPAIRSTDQIVDSGYDVYELDWLGVSLTLEGGLGVGNDQRNVGRFVE